MKRNPNFQITNHTLDILRAAVPYVNPNTQNSMNVILKATELVDTVRDVQEPDLSACDLNQEPFDPEVLLMNLRPVCYQPELDIVDMILNFLKARKIYQAYQTFNTDTVQAAQMDQRQENYNYNTEESSQEDNESTQNQATNQTNAQANNNHDNGMMNFLLSQLSPEQRSTFDTFQMFLNSMPQHNNS